MSTRTRLIVIVIVSLTTVVFTVAFASRFGADPQLSPSPLIGTAAPAITLYLVESDQTLSLADLAGDIIVINFWAPWCIPCREEHSDLLELAAGYDPLGVSIVGIVYQSREDDVIRFLDELGRGYTIGMDDSSRAAIGFGVRGVPETYFIDRDGVIVAKITGPSNFGLVAATLDRIIVGDPVQSTKTGDLQIEP